MGTINGYTKDGVALIYGELQKLRTALGKNKETDQMPQVYYTEIAKMFNGFKVEFMIAVIDKLVIEYRDYNMPSGIVIKAMIREVKFDSSEYRPKPIYENEVRPSETEKDAAIRIANEWIEKNLSKKRKSTSEQKVIDRHNRIRFLLVSGKEYCDVDHKWVNKGDAKKVHVWDFMKNKGLDLKGCLS